MSRFIPVLVVLVVLTSPAWAWDLSTVAGQQEHCRYLREGTVARSVEPDYCEPAPAENANLFWNLVLAAGVLVAIGWEVTRRVKP